MICFELDNRQSLKIHLECPYFLANLKHIPMRKANFWFIFELQRKWFNN
jgi:hypothetical protein